MQFLSVVVGTVGDVLPSAPVFTVVVVVLHFLGPEMAAALNRKKFHIICLFYSDYNPEFCFLYCFQPINIWWIIICSKPFGKFMSSIIFYTVF